MELYLIVRECNIQKISEDFPPLLKLCLDGEGADLKITVDDGSFMVHKSVIFRNSPSLEKLNQEAKHKTILEVRLKPVSYPILKVILEGFYSGEMGSLNMFDIAAKTKYLQVLHVLGNSKFLEPCLSYCITNITVQNCVQLLQFAKSCNLSNHEQTCLEYIGRHFPNLIKLDSYKNLSFRDIFEIFSTIDVVAKPCQMYYAVSEWILSADIENWAYYVRKLLNECSNILRKRENYTPKYRWENPFFISECDDEDLHTCFGDIATEYWLRENHNDDYDDITDEGYSDAEY